MTDAYGMRTTIGFGIVFVAAHFVDVNYYGGAYTRAAKVVLYQVAKGVSQVVGL